MLQTPQNIIFTLNIQLSIRNKSIYSYIHVITIHSTFHHLCRSRFLSGAIFFCLKDSLKIFVVHIWWLWSFSGFICCLFHFYFAIYVHWVDNVGWQFCVLFFFQFFSDIDLIQTKEGFLVWFGLVQFFQNTYF